jgi:UDP:flavonoid glycosyltransferase YjiC (YdhE family)
LPPGLFPPASDVPALLSGKSRRSLGAVDRLFAPLHRRLTMTAASMTIGRTQNACRRTRGLAPIDLHTRLAGRRILVNSAFGIEYPRPLPPDLHMVGPMLDPNERPLTADENDWLTGGPPVVFVNLGTVATPSREHLGKLAAGLSSPDFRVLWVLRPPARDWLSPVPDTVRLESWVSSQRSVLAHPNVRAFVSHCGTNSVQESIWEGTPIVGFPMFGPQADMALRIEDAGVGIRLDKTHFTPDALRAAIGRLLGDRSFADATAPIRTRFEEAGGVRRAADLIEESLP